MENEDIPINSLQVKQLRKPFAKGYVSLDKPIRASEPSGNPQSSLTAVRRGVRQIGSEVLRSSPGTVLIGPACPIRVATQANLISSHSAIR